MTPLSNKPRSPPFSELMVSTENFFAISAKSLPSRACVPGRMPVRVCVILHLHLHQPQRQGEYAVPGVVLPGCIDLCFPRSTLARLLIGFHLTGNYLLQRQGNIFNFHFFRSHELLFIRIVVRFNLFSAHINLVDETITLERH